MHQTANFHLNLWEPTDRILREDFNGDNAKLDAALKTNAAAIAAETEARQAADTSETAARIAGDLRVKLLDYTTEESTTYLPVSLEGIDLSPYQELEVVADIKCSNELHMRVNNGRSYTSLTSASTTSIAYCAIAQSDPNSKNQIRARILARDGSCLCCISDNISPSSYQQIVCHWSGRMTGIRTLDFQGASSTGNFPTLEAGARITVYGLLR